MNKADECNLLLMSLQLKGYEVKQYPNYQLQVNGVNFWTGTGKWFDPASSKGGYSYNEFIAHLESLKEPKPAPEPKALVLTDFEVALIEFIRSYREPEPHDDSVDALRYSVSPPWD